MNKTPTLSIAIPTYNRRDDLLRCLSSVLPQLTDDVELLVVDNASDIPVSSFVDHPRVRIVRNPINIGAVGNLLRTFELANADWVWLIGDDDEANPTGVATILSHIACLPEAGHIFFSNYMGVIDKTQIAKGDDAFIACYRVQDFGARLWMSGQVLNRRVAAGNLRYAYAYPSSSPQLVLALLAARSEAVVFSESEVAIHHSAAYHEMWDPYTIYDQMTQMLSLNIGGKLRSHMARCFFSFFSNYDKHFLEVLHTRFADAERLNEMRRIFMLRWQAIFSCFDNYQSLLADLHGKVAVLDNPQHAETYYAQLSEQQKSMLWPSARVGYVK